ncbi:MAG TPA: IS4 family transposase, partial [Gaiellales bacterium]|nr:IS4 family transposase [Gaiellales bacterium]
PMPLPLATLRQTAVFMGGSRPPDVGLGLLTRWCPASLIDAAIETCDTREQRVRVLSARSVVYCELARCLFPGEGYEQILDHLLSRDDDIPAWRTDHIPCGSSLCRARVKIGSRTMEAVFHRVAGPIAEPQSCPAAFWHQLRLEAFDGTTFEVADTEENDAAFERPAGSCGPGGYPQVRVVALVECATHAVLDAVIGGRGQGETTLALDLAGAAGPGTLVLADRNMLGVQLWTAFRDRGAELLWRLKKTVATRPEAVLEDGSWLARVRIDKHTAAALRRAGQRVPGAITVRVIEYTLPGSAEVYRLATSLLDPATAPAAELAALYHERWESEGVFAEIKIVQRGPQAVLRSARPDGVRQQLWAHLTVHHLIRDLLCHAAASVNSRLDQRRISFRRAFRLIRRSITSHATPRLLDRMLAHAISRLVGRTNPNRRPRSYPRAVKRRAMTYPTKKPGPSELRRCRDFAPAIRRRPP